MPLPSELTKTPGRAAPPGGTPWVPTATPRQPRYDSLDFWRGVACLFVVLYHSVIMFENGPAASGPGPAGRLLNVFSGLSIGVPLFFVISGYCIAAAADGCRKRGDGLATYMRRRIRRIYPPLWILTACAVVLFVVVDVVVAPGLLSGGPWAQLRPWWYSPWQWAGNLTLTETWRHYVVGGPRGHFPGQAWTLCYEEQFYLLMGLLLIAPRHLFKGCVAITAVTIGVVVVGHLQGWTLDGVFLDGTWLTFAGGVLVYHVLNYGSRAALIAAGFVLLLAAAVGDRWGVPGGTAAFLFAFVILVLRPFDGHLVRARLARPVNWCGQMCYSLYLVHQLPVKTVSTVTYRAGLTSAYSTLFVTVPLCVIVSLAAGWIFHLTVERRFMNHARPAGAAVPRRGLVADSPIAVR